MVVEGEFVLSPDPVTIGHEAVGQIVKLGTTSQDRGFKEGDFVGFTNACHACFQCEGLKVTICTAQEASSECRDSLSMAISRNTFQSTLL